MEAELRGPESCNRNEQHEVRRDLPGQVLERERHRVLIALIFPARRLRFFERVTSGEALDDEGSQGGVK